MLLPTVRLRVPLVYPAASLRISPGNTHDWGRFNGAGSEFVLDWVYNLTVNGLISVLASTFVAAAGASVLKKAISIRAISIQTALFILTTSLQVWQDHGVLKPTRTFDISQWCLKSSKHIY